MAWHFKLEKVGWLFTMQPLRLFQHAASYHNHEVSEALTAHVVASNAASSPQHDSFAAAGTASTAHLAAGFAMVAAAAAAIAAGTPAMHPPAPAPAAMVAAAAAANAAGTTAVYPPAAAEHVVLRMVMQVLKVAVQQLRLEVQVVHWVAAEMECSSHW